MSAKSKFEGASTIFSHTPVFALYTKSISSSIDTGGARTLLDMYNNTNDVSKEQFGFAISVFTELEFLTNNGTYTVNSSVKKELSTSTIYNKVQTLN